MQNQEQPWYLISDIEQLDSPALVIYPERVRMNIATAIKMIADVDRLRPHVKTHKSLDVTRLMLEAGITKFKCATIAEAGMLGMAGAPDVLLAYQPIGPKADRFLQLIKNFPSTRYSCLIDNIDAALQLNALAVAQALQVPVFIDLNVGMNRTGITPGHDAIVLAEKVATLPALRLSGLHAYDGHIGDADLEQRTKKCNEAFAPVEEMMHELAEKGFQNLVLVAGGSPTFPIHAKRPAVECSPGTFVYWDSGYTETLPEQPFLPAALVVTRIVSLPSKNLVCTDLGHKSVAAENPLQRRVRFINAPGMELVGQSEEHLLLKTPMDNLVTIGDVLYGIPIHICPTCALYEKAVVVENGAVVGEWKTTARDRKITL